MSPWYSFDFHSVIVTDELTGNNVLLLQGKKLNKTKVKLTFHFTLLYFCLFVGRDVIQAKAEARK